MGPVLGQDDVLLERGGDLVVQALALEPLLREEARLVAARVREREGVSELSGEGGEEVERGRREGEQGEEGRRTGTRRRTGW